MCPTIASLPGPRLLNFISSHLFSSFPSFAPRWSCGPLTRLSNKTVTESRDLPVPHHGDVHSIPMLMMFPLVASTVTLYATSLQVYCVWKWILPVGGSFSASQGPQRNCTGDLSVTSWKMKLTGRRKNRVIRETEIRKKK